MLVFCDFFLLDKKINWCLLLSSMCRNFRSFPCIWRHQSHPRIQRNPPYTFLTVQTDTNVPHIISLLLAGGNRWEAISKNITANQPIGNFSTLSKCKILKTWQPIRPVRYISTPDYTFLMQIQKIWHPIRYLFTAGHSIWIQNSKNSVGQPANDKSFHIWNMNSNSRNVAANQNVFPHMATSCECKITKMWLLDRPISSLSKPGHTV